MKSKLVLIGVAGLLAIHLSAQPLRAQKFEEFTVKQVRGSSCEVMPEGGAWKAVKDGEVCKSGAKGRTGAGQSSFVAAFDEQNQFRLLPKTEVVIRTSTRDSRFQKVIDVTMSKGSVEVDLKAFPKGYQMKVQTPTAVCGAVGTEFTVQSDSREENSFECRNGTIFASSRDDGSFDAPQIREGQSLKANVAPGKENSYAQLKTSGGAMPIAVGSKGNQLKVQEDSTIQVAQEHSKSAKQVAVKVQRGGVNDAGPGRYVMDDGSLQDVSKDSKVAGWVDEYVELTQAEGQARSEVERVKAGGAAGGELDDAQKRLDQAAAKATAKRKELFNRDAIRRAVRGGMDLPRSRPTSIPR